MFVIQKETGFKKICITNLTLIFDVYLHVNEW